MAIIQVNKRARLDDIIANKQTGAVCSYIEDVGDAKIIRQVKFADKLNKGGESAYIEVKFVSKYSEREKRLEIVSKKDKTITVFKISKSSRFDKDAIEMQKTIDEMNSIYSQFDYNFVGVLLFNFGADLESIRKHLMEMGVNDVLVSTY